MLSHKVPSQPNFLPGSLQLVHAVSAKKTLGMLKRKRLLAHERLVLGLFELLISQSIIPDFSYSFPSVALEVKRGKVERMTRDATVDMRIQTVPLSVGEVLTFVPILGAIVL